MARSWLRSTSTTSRPRVSTGVGVTHCPPMVEAAVDGVAADHARAERKNADPAQGGRPPRLWRYQREPLRRLTAWPSAEDCHLPLRGSARHRRPLPSCLCMRVDSLVGLPSPRAAPRGRPQRGVGHPTFPPSEGCARSIAEPAGYSRGGAAGEQRRPCHATAASASHCLQRIRGYCCVIKLTAAAVESRLPSGSSFRSSCSRVAPSLRQQQ